MCLSEMSIEIGSKASLKMITDICFHWQEGPYKRVCDHQLPPLKLVNGLPSTKSADLALTVGCCVILRLGLLTVDQVTLVGLEHAS